MIYGVVWLCFFVLVINYYRDTIQNYIVEARRGATTVRRYFNFFVGLVNRLVDQETKARQLASYQIINEELVKITLADSVLYLPYDRTKVARTMGLQAMLVLPNGTMFDITQRCGVPYLVAPRSLGAKIVVKDTLTDKEYTYYDGAPGYCDELLVDHDDDDRLRNYYEHAATDDNRLRNHHRSSYEHPSSGNDESEQDAGVEEVEELEKEN